MSTTSSGMSMYRSVVISCRISSIGKIAERSPGVAGAPVFGLSGGSSGEGRSAWILYRPAGHLLLGEVDLGLHDQLLSLYIDIHCCREMALISRSATEFAVAAETVQEFVRPLDHEPGALPGAGSASRRGRRRTGRSRAGRTRRGRPSAGPARAWAGSGCSRAARASGGRRPCCRSAPALPARVRAARPRGRRPSLSHGVVCPDPVQRDLERGRRPPVHLLRRRRPSALPGSGLRRVGRSGAPERPPDADAGDQEEERERDPGGTGATTRSSGRRRRRDRCRRRGNGRGGRRRHGRRREGRSSRSRR